MGARERGLGRVVETRGPAKTSVQVAKTVIFSVADQGCERAAPYHAIFPPPPRNASLAGPRAGFAYRGVGAGRSPRMRADNDQASWASHGRSLAMPRAPQKPSRTTNLRINVHPVKGGRPAGFPPSRGEASITALSYGFHAALRRIDEDRHVAVRVLVLAHELVTRAGL